MMPNYTTTLPFFTTASDICNSGDTIFLCIIYHVRSFHHDRSFHLFGKHLFFLFHNIIICTVIVTWEFYHKHIHPTWFPILYNHLSSSLTSSSHHNHYLLIFIYITTFPLLNIHFPFSLYVSTNTPLLFLPNLIQSPQQYTQFSISHQTSTSHTPLPTMRPTRNSSTLGKTGI